jgi:hypothetical protein
MTTDRFTAAAVAGELPTGRSRVLPEDVGSFPLPKQGALVLNQIHYGPSFVPDSDRSYFNIFTVRRRHGAICMTW